MIQEKTEYEINAAFELLSRPTAKRVRQAADILMGIVKQERKGYCDPSPFVVYGFKPAERKLVTLKKYVCVLCPSCGSKTFDLDTTIMQGSCLSCSFKSVNYKSDMQKREIARMSNRITERTSERGKERSVKNRNPTK